MISKESLVLALRFERAGNEYRVEEVNQGITARIEAAEIISLASQANEKGRPANLALADAQALRQKVFDVLFRGRLLEYLDSLRRSAGAEKNKIILCLELDGAEELEDCPWEFLADPESADGLSILRTITSLKPQLDRAIVKPMRILAIVASPNDLPPFDVDREWEALVESLETLVNDGHVVVERLEDASEAGLLKALAEQPTQALHFVGYGRSNLRARYGSLLFEGQDRNARAVTAEHLANLLDRHLDAQLMVLNLGRNADELNPFAGTARILVRNGLGAVVAMRRRLSGRATVGFYRELYSALSFDLSVEQSMVNARRLLAQRSREVEWGLPMLYARAGRSATRARLIGSSANAERDMQVSASLQLTSLKSSAEETGAEQASQENSSESAGYFPTFTEFAHGNSRKAKRILILAASPENMTLLRLGEESREIDAGLRRAKYRQRFQLQQRSAVRPLDLQQAMLEFEPQIVHFCGHGAGGEGLILEDNNGKAKPVPSIALANLFGLFSGKVECVVLNSCHTEYQAKAIAEHIGYVVGMKRQISDRAAINFAIGFYCALGAGHGIEFAFQMGRSAIELENLPGNLAPVLLMSR